MCPTEDRVGYRVVFGYAPFENFEGLAKFAEQMCGWQTEARRCVPTTTTAQVNGKTK